MIIDPQKCRGNQLCMEACPYENVIYFNDVLNIAQKCTFCAHLLDDGWSEPRCVDACPTGAFTFGEEEDLKDLIAQAEPLKPEISDVKPRVYYIGLPKKFIAGALYDKEADECTENANVTATNIGTGEKSSAVSDSYGDFWLKGLKNGQYTLLIEKTGYLTQKFGPVDVSKRHERRRHRSLEGMSREIGGKGPAPAEGGRALLCLGRRTVPQAVRREGRALRPGPRRVTRRASPVTARRSTPRPQPATGTRRCRRHCDGGPRRGACSFFGRGSKSE